MITLRLPQKICQCNGTGGLDHRRGAGDDARVVPSVDGQRLDLAGADVERILHHADGGVGLMHARTMSGIPLVMPPRMPPAMRKINKDSQLCEPRFFMLPLHYIHHEQKGLPPLRKF